MLESGYFPAGAEFDPSAPYNQSDPEEKDFKVTCSQSLSKTVTVTTGNYIPGASGVDYDSDDEGGTYAIPYQDPPDTSDTNWQEEFSNNDYHTPLELISILKTYVEQDLKGWEQSPEDPNHKYKRMMEIRRLKNLLENCKNWTEDDLEFIEE